MLVGLKSLMKIFKEDEESLNTILSSFSCSKDNDIQDFLWNKAVNFEKISKSRTYLICDENELKEGNLIILGYFTLALKVLYIPKKFSNRKRKNLDGYSYKFNGKQVSEIPCYLIGQLAKNSSVDNNYLTGNDIIEEAYRIIANVSREIGGRYILVECHDNNKLKTFYNDNYFQEFAFIADNDIPMIQMIRKIAIN